MILSCSILFSRQTEHLLEQVDIILLHADIGDDLLSLGIGNTDLQHASDRNALAGIAEELNEFRVTVAEAFEHGFDLQHCKRVHRNSSFLFNFGRSLSSIIADMEEECKMLTKDCRIPIFRKIEFFVQIIVFLRIF